MCKEMGRSVYGDGEKCIRRWGKRAEIGEEGRKKNGKKKHSKLK